LLEKIGDFSRRCEVTIKALRHYDKLGLLTPDYIDKYTGYRYYGIEKVTELQRIVELKEAGFSLDEIKQLSSDGKDGKDNEKYKIVRQKRQELEKLAEDTARQISKLSQLEEKLSTSKDMNLKGENNMNNKFNMPFVDDEVAIGRWDFITAIDKREDFNPVDEYDNKMPYEELYFLPDGVEYWGFSWTKEYLKVSFGDGMLCPYEITEISGGQYMFVKCNSTEKNEIWVLKQRDKKHYTKKEISRFDYIGLPFDNDDAVIGIWNVVDLVRNIEDFDPNKKNWTGDLFYTKAEFLPDGILHNYFDNNNPVKHGNMKWTRGTALLSYGDGTTLAPAYEIRNINGTEYLFIEWKSGDYVWGKRKPPYYIFKRDI